jgi:hypothetical protein
MMGLVSVSFLGNLLENERSCKPAAGRSPRQRRSPDVEVRMLKKRIRWIRARRAAIRQARDPDFMLGNCCENHKRVRTCGKQSGRPQTSNFESEGDVAQLRFLSAKHISVRMLNLAQVGKAMARYQFLALKPAARTRFRTGSTSHQTRFGTGSSYLNQVFNNLLPPN